MSGVVQLAAFGTISRALLKELAAPLSQELGLEPVILPEPLVEPKYAFNKDRNQFHSSAILRRLSGLRTGEQVGVLGVADFDLFVPDVDFVFGESDRELKAGIVSLKRLRSEFHGEPANAELLRKRGRTELCHEVGQLLGLAHCEDPRCAMYSAVTLADADRRNTAICGNCRAELGRTARRR